MFHDTEVNEPSILQQQNEYQEIKHRLNTKSHPDVISLLQHDHG